MVGSLDVLQLRYIIAASYPAVFIATIPSYYFLKQYGSIIGANPLVSFFEDYIVKSYGYIWFTLIYFSFLFLYIQSDYKVPISKIIQFLRSYGLNSLFFFLTQVWFFGSSIFERINIATGGHCINDLIKSESYCKSNGYQWINGFDSSGHFYFLISISLLVWGELINHLGIQSRSKIPNDDIEQAGDYELSRGTTINNQYFRLYKTIVLSVAFIFISIWYFMYLITCIFFHTIPEKFAGLLKVFSNYLKISESGNEIPSTNKLQELEADHSYISLNGNDVNIYYKSRDSLSQSVLQSLLKRLIKSITIAGFKILSWELFTNDELVGNSNSHDYKSVAEIEEDVGIFDVFNLYSKFISSRAKRNHIKNCKACQHERSQKETEKEKEKEKKIADDSDSSTIETIVGQPDKEFRAVFAIIGMTCASCVQTVSESLSKLLDNGQDINLKKGGGDEANFSVNLINKTAVVIMPNKQIINKIVDAINDLGFECKLLEVLPVQRTINTKVTAMISGMTCVACANSIQSAVNELPFVLESGINVVTKSGQFVLENEDDKNLIKLKETIEDCGFDYELINSEKINFTSSKKKSRTINISVEGMHCDHCPNLINNYLSSYGEAIVINDEISLSHPYIKFTYIPGINLTIRKLLFDLNHIEPLDSDEDAYKINVDKKGLFNCELVEPLSIDEHVKRLHKKELLRLAYRLILTFIFAIPTFIFGIVAMSLLPSSNGFRKWVEEPIWSGNVSRVVWILFFLSTPVYFFAADVFHRKAIKEVTSLWLHKNSFKSRIFKFGSMNLLMSLGTSIAYFASIALLILSSQQSVHTHMGLHTTYFDSVVFLSFFLLIGRLLESYSKGKTANAIASLSALKVQEATVVDLENSNYINDTVVNVKYLEFGDTIKIASGESPAVDCVIEEGISEFDESALTGESIPVKHGPGHQIFSGTVNIGNNVIIARVISIEGDSLIDQIVSTVRDGQLRKAPIERTADVLTGYFVPVITLLAIITWIIWLVLGETGSLPSNYLDIDIGGWVVWSLEFSIAVFVIACPCGIGLAAPTALFVGSGLAAKYGILAKGGGVAFQDGASTNVVCFDKTGTLTKGELQITDYSFNIDVESKSEIIKTFALQITRDLELASKHPLAKSAKSFVENFGNKMQTFKGSPNKVPQVETVPGKGLKGNIIYEEGEEDIWNKYKPKAAFLGNEQLVKDHNIKISEKHQKLLEQWKEQCKSLILVGLQCFEIFNDEEFHLVLSLAARDEIRVETKKVIEYLTNKLNIECWMITGDNRVTAEAIGKELGISNTNIVSEVLPDEKQAHVKRIRKLKGDKGIVAMIGDGINDSPALATADVGIALASGADLAVTSSDFILLNKSFPLISLLTLFDLSRVVFKRVKFNFGWSLVYNIIGIPIAAGVIYPYNNTRLNPVWASVAMAASSISVVSSSLALKFYRPRISTKDFDSIINKSPDAVYEPIEH
ncbi:copper-transporting P1-type ATPase [Scheffersomyces amazonensis]|uniref:copper-transporting P1-type ATPase n=1 Tax=Scheffersomyces amazonensis TaxID=1078765 RepID=UPI00315D1ED2